MEHCSACGRGDLKSHFKCKNCQNWFCRHCFVSATALCVACDNVDPHADALADFEAGP